MNTNLASIRQSFGQTLLQLAKVNKNIWVVDADLKSSLAFLSVLLNVVLLKIMPPELQQVWPSPVKPFFSLLLPVFHPPSIGLLSNSRSVLIMSLL